MAQAKLRLPIGKSDFRQVIEGGYDWVDKSLFIQEILDDAAGVVLIPRPRRFGKTLNMSMLYYFLSNREKNTRALFEHTKIWQAGEAYQKVQGQYPTIFISLKDVKVGTEKGAMNEIAERMALTYRKYDFLLEKFDDIDREYYMTIIRQKANWNQLSSSLVNLMRFLHKHFNQKVVVLIDEYDRPMHSAYVDQYYKNMKDFMGSFLGKAECIGRSYSSMSTTTLRLKCLCKKRIKLANDALS